MLFVLGTPLIGGAASVWFGAIALQQVESLTAIHALNGRPDVINRRREYLLDIMNEGIHRNLRVGVVFVVSYLSVLLKNFSLNIDNYRLSALLSYKGDLRWNMIVGSNRSYH